MKPLKLNDRVTFKATRYREYPKLTAVMKSKNFTVSKEPQPNPTMHFYGVEVTDDYGNTYEYFDFWLKRTKQEPNP